MVQTQAPQVDEVTITSSWVFMAKQRMKRRLRAAHADYLDGKMTDTSLDQRVQSYLGILSHANQHTLSQAIKNAYGLRT